MKYPHYLIVLIFICIIALALVSCGTEVGVGSYVPTEDATSQKPTDSLVTTVPTAPAASTLPSQPETTVPTRVPTMPTEPSEPIAPTDPITPTDPTKPTESTMPTEPASDELIVLLDAILAEYGSSPQNIYDYVHDHFKYKYTREKSMVENAMHLLEYGTGSCYNFAALTYYLFQRAGYEVYYVTGLGWQHGTYHC